ncbi:MULTISPECIES: TolC family protein [Chryseobacterium]|uniref:Outer membrane protein n=1 Tax=Chryseobacterium camelliae TaxID=1265445 RepID=A0ABU0THP9_9FLAO|nr:MULTISPECIES: TolC family protein [Chryseobacterium]MDT3406528.1 outer membrane protein [Pseudacidovorax intermedius]MDQ1095673.1 outer membrane protein [Chryseobacterium camelliae]MDQ1099610.1 outer membrane protein [Chryseobacterium sp. SORGH_AS_1048]MDR6086958.1 outer membrane protein [Chryseobacterium sp. SORGH_AS_0909]MDR6131330.1 outer membrane protein [Chryseobacterium sp. SORGH_AS_1175]
MVKNIKTALSIVAAVFPALFFSQHIRQMTAEEVAQLAVQNHQQLKVAAQNIGIARQNTQVVKLQKLPTITASTSQFYLGNAVVIDKDFSNTTTVQMPHYGSSYAVQATQLIFKGGLVNKSIELAGLREQLSELDLEKNKQDVKFLVISNYLDVYKIVNQYEVFRNNKKLAQERLKNIQKFYEQGMVTRNEVIRGELAIKNLDQGILSLVNNRKILNYNLNIALGLPEDTEIVPVENLENKEAGIGMDYYLNLAHDSNPVMKSAKTNIDVADKNIDIIKTDKIPTIAGFGGYSLQKPITTRNPVLDMYSGGWQTGVSLTYNIDNLYKTKERVKLGELQKNQAYDAMTLTQQNIDMAVNAAYVKYQESIQQAEILNDAKKLAEENYKITEAKYLNQLAVQAEMIDAQNQKLQSELDFANAEINVLYQYYNLLKTTGTL